MKFRHAAICLALVTLETQAAGPWIFEDRLAVTAPPADAVFHHLDGAGRKHIALNTEAVAVVWEANRSGSPQVYAALRPLARDAFSEPIRISSGKQAYEPGIAAVGADRFVLVYEQDASVYARLLGVRGPGEPLLLSAGAAGHASVTAYGDRIFAAWREREAGEWFVRLAVIEVGEADRLLVDSRQPVESEGLQTPVLFPAVAASEAGLCVAWEDRRAGHTRLLVSHAAGAGEAFGEPRDLNEYFSGRNEYDRGNGVTRVSLASFGRDEILAAWMDKRRSGGYGIFAALGGEGGAIFGPNEKVHGEQGDLQPHYNPATAGNAAGLFVVAWDDFRRGDSDIWLSRYNAELEWGEDFAPPIAAGDGEQSHPSIALDEHGNLHLLWIERGEQDAPTRLWYALGRVRSGSAL